MIGFAVPSADTESITSFVRAFELGKWQGNLRMEFEKERVYTRLDRYGNPRIPDLAMAQDLGMLEMTLNPKPLNPKP